jgi:hypothetical protein
MIPGFTAALVVPNDSFVQNYPNPKTKAPLTCGQTVITETETEYDFTANSLSEANSELTTPDAGKTSWTWSLAGTAACPVVTVNVNTNLPDWTDCSWSGFGIACACSEWNRFLNALRIHEQGHVDLVEQFFDEFNPISNKLAGHTVSEMNQIISQAAAKLQTTSNNYDTSTNHGATQGAVLHPSACQPCSPNTTSRSTNIHSQTVPMLFGAECNGQCVDTRTDPNNCGDCGNVCLSDQTCIDGVCTCAASGQEQCGNSCVNTS